MREAPIRGPPHNPGQGGWPTIRYFNKDTGVNGASFVQKTSGRVCTELGNVDNMKAYVRDVSNAGGAPGSTSAPADTKAPAPAPAPASAPAAAAPEPEAPKAAPACQLSALDKCETREQKYVKLYRTRSLEQQEASLKSIRELIVNNEDLGSRLDWAVRRINLLTQLIAAGEKAPSHDEL